jgi:hypothetical protein
MIPSVAARVTGRSVLRIVPLAVPVTTRGLDQCAVPRAAHGVAHRIAEGMVGPTLAWVMRGAVGLLNKYLFTLLFARSSQWQTVLGWMPVKLTIPICDQSV